MDDLREELEMHLLVWQIVKIQLEILDRLQEPIPLAAKPQPVLVARPFDAIYEPVKEVTT